MRYLIPVERSSIVRNDSELNCGEIGDGPNSRFSDNICPEREAGECCEIELSDVELEAIVSHE